MVSGLGEATWRADLVSRLKGRPWWGDLVSKPWGRLPWVLSLGGLPWVTGLKRRHGGATWQAVLASPLGETRW